MADGGRVTVEVTDSEVFVDATEDTIEIVIGTTGPQGPSGFLGTNIEKVGTDFSGNDGDLNRAFTHTSSLTTTMMVFAEGVLLTSTKYSLSTVTNANDTITMLVPIYDDDEVTIRL